MSKPALPNRYKRLAEKIFFNHWSEGATEFEFQRDEMEGAATALEIQLPKNLGDVIYALRFRIGQPDSVVATQPEGKEWELYT